MKYFLTFFCSLLVMAPTLALAQYTELVNIPGVGGGETDGFDGYINAVYAMFISIAALLAVVKIIVAGVKYMFTDIAPQKTSAKNDIQGALLGLVVVLAAVLILTVINPDLTNFDLNTQELPEPRPQPDQFTDQPQTASEGCSQLQTDCTETTDSYGSRLSFNLDKNSDEYISQFQAVLDGCLNEGSRLVISQENRNLVSGYCHESNEQTRQEILAIYNSGGIPGVNVEKLLNDFETDVAPFTAENLDQNTLFDIPKDKSSDGVEEICIKFGGEYNSSIFDDRITCTLET